MQSTLTPQETDPHDTFLIEPDVVLATRADHALPDPVQDALSRLAHRAAHTTPSVTPSVSAGAPTPTGGGTPAGEAKQVIANWMPPFVLALSSPTATPPPPAEQPDSSPAQATT